MNYASRETKGTFSDETFVRWYEAFENAIVIWLYYLGVDVCTSTRRGLFHRFHEEVLESLGRPDNPFFDIFNRRDLLHDLREHKRMRNAWRHDSLPFEKYYTNWRSVTTYLGDANNALGDAFETFSEKRLKFR